MNNQDSISQRKKKIFEIFYLLIISLMSSVIFNQKIITLQASYKNGVRDKAHGGVSTNSSVITIDDSLISGHASTNVLVIVTGYSNNHFLALITDLLPSVVTNVLVPALNNTSMNLQIKVICYDLNPPQIRRTNESITMVEQIHSMFPFIDYRYFDYTSYPPHFDISKNRGEYAWKPVIIAEVVEQHQYDSYNSSFVYWLDAGISITQELFGDDIKVASYQGIFSPRAVGNLKQWTHEGTARYFGMNMNVFNSSHTPIYSGGIVVFDAKNETIVKCVVEPWADCARKIECIAPPGSSRKNHRQDQSALSILVNMLHINILNSERDHVFSVKRGRHG